MSGNWGKQRKYAGDGTGCTPFKRHMRSDCEKGAVSEQMNFQRGV